jgi:Protein of unknown function (DUF4065)
MQFDREKYKAVILYTCVKCEAHQLGAVKLHKVLYYADMLHYAHMGAPMTGSTYRKRPHGPTSDELLQTLRELEKQRQFRFERLTTLVIARKTMLHANRRKLND